MTRPGLIQAKLAAVCFSALLLFSFSSFAEPAINTKFDYYTVSPQSKNDIASSLNAASPIRQDGQVFHGLTASYIEWQFWWNTNEGKCFIERVTVNVDIVFTLPKLQASSKEVKTIWNKWYPKLVNHEHQHKNNAVVIARQIEQGIAAMPAEKNCQGLERQANKLGRQLLEKLAEMDKAYDKKTHHGETEGASIYSYL